MVQDHIVEQAVVVEKSWSLSVVIDSYLTWDSAGSVGIVDSCAVVADFPGNVGSVVQMAGQDQAVEDCEAVRTGYCEAANIGDWASVCAMEA